MPPRRNQQFYDLALSIWNQERLPNWTHHRGLIDRAKGQVDKMVEYFGEEEFEIAFRAALAHAKKRDFWRTAGNFSFTNVFSNDKGIEYAEAEFTNAPELVPGGLYRLRDKPGWVARVHSVEGTTYVCTIAHVEDVSGTREDDVRIPVFDFGERIHEKQSRTN